jgi:23S rRNA pseudouridine1911/1915/1917 synthase
VTNVRVLEPLGGGVAAWVECRLETGRTHQIRVHLAEQAGTPLLADALYGALPSNVTLRQVGEALGRQALHAKSLGFVHPVSQEQLFFESELPDDLSRALAALR